MRKLIWLACIGCVMLIWFMLSLMFVVFNVSPNPLLYSTLLTLGIVVSVIGLILGYERLTA